MAVLVHCPSSSCQSRSDVDNKTPAAFAVVVDVNVHHAVPADGAAVAGAFEQEVGCGSPKAKA
jgi:hypothetical protein